MARVNLFAGLIGLIGSALLAGLIISALPTTHARAAPLHPVIRQQILKAAVQITMVREEVHDIGLGEASQGRALINRTQVVTRTEGIGTLIEQGGEILLVTHNHWPPMVDSAGPARIEFRDAWGQLLLEIDGLDFQRAILYEDNGMLISRAPVKLLVWLEPAASSSYSQGMLPDRIVQVVRHQPGTAMKLSLLAARVTAVSEDDGDRVITLRSLGGDSIKPGDSGGGVWFSGSLVGNLWMTIREKRKPVIAPQTSTTHYTDRSRAASLRTELLDGSPASSGQNRRGQIGPGSGSYFQP